ncbi:MAG: flippase-like domain-containing protein [Verrucomicrobia bacterium]|nr:flippase-like domain-containing protein [Verrucomicrobiota bacterium]
MCIAATVALLWLIFRKIEFRTLGESLERTSLLWSSLAFLVYGVALALQANRWHLALLAVNRAVHPMASWRLAMVGHFFFTVFFGMAGGDAAKSAFHSRWFRFPLPEVLAAAPLDRGLSLAGALLLAVFTWALAAVSGGLDSLGNVPFQSPGFWVVLGIVLIAVTVMVVTFWQPAGEGALARLIRALRSGGGRLLLSPKMTGSGLFIATAGHLGLSAVFALNLYAVAGPQLPWSQLSWTIPAITTISCLPFTVAGAGVREMAAITLLGLYAVPSAECVVASMLTMIHKLMWAGVGAGVLWREQSVQEAWMPVATSEDVSIVLAGADDSSTETEAARLRTLPGVCDVTVESQVDVLSGMVAPASRGRGEVVLGLRSGAVLSDETLRRVLDALRDRSVVGGIAATDLGAGLLGTMDPRWMLRQFRPFSNGADAIIFFRRSALADIHSKSGNSLESWDELFVNLRREGRLLKL